jgi:hypothetical protein
MRAFLILNSKFLISVCALVVAHSWGPAVGAQASPTALELKSKTERRLQEIAARVDGVVGYEMLDLTSGEKISRHPDRPPRHGQCRQADAAAGPERHEIAAPPDGRGGRAAW